MTEYNKRAAVTRERLYLDAMQQVYTNTTKLIVDQNSGSNLLFLPLDKILQMSGAGAVAAVGRGQRPAAAESQPRRGARRGSALARGLPQPRAGGTPMNARLRSSADRARGRAGRARSLTPVHRRSAPERHRVPPRRAGERDSRPRACTSSVPLLDNVRFFDVRILTLDSEEPERFITSEKKNVLVDSFVKFRIIDVVQYYISVGGDEARAKIRLAQTVNDSLRAEFGKRTIHEVVSGERDRIMAADAREGRYRRAQVSACRCWTCG